MSYASVSFTQLDAKETEHVKQILNDINPLLKKWKDILKDQKFRDVRNKIFNSPQQLPIPDDFVSEYEEDICKIRELRKPQPELGNRTVEEAMLDGFSRLAMKFAVSYFTKAKPDCLTIDDLMQECLFKIYEATYRWIPEKGSFSNFLILSLNRHLQLVINDNRFLSPINEEGIKIFSKFLKASRENEHILRDEDVIESMNLTKDEYNHLHDILKCMSICRESTLTDSETNDDSSGFIDSWVVKEKTTSESDCVLQKLYVEEVIEAANLSPMELDLLQNAMNPYHGWQRDFKERYVSPVTNRPYTKQRISQMVTEVKDKLIATLKKLGDDVVVGLS